MKMAERGARSSQSRNWRGPGYEADQESISGVGNLRRIPSPDALASRCSCHDFWRRIELSSQCLVLLPRPVCRSRRREEGMECLAAEIGRVLRRARRERGLTL
jgi:hypothetical protein